MPYATILDVMLILTRSDHVLLAQRQGTGYADGQWNLPSGKVEAGEHAIAAIMREAREEIGIRLDPAGLRPVGAVHCRNPDGQPRLGLFFAMRPTPPARVSRSTPNRTNAPRSLGSRSPCCRRTPSPTTPSGSTFTGTADASPSSAGTLARAGERTGRGRSGWPYHMYCLGLERIRRMSEMQVTARKATAADAMALAQLRWTTEEHGDAGTDHAAFTGSFSAWVIEHLSTHLPFLAEVDNQVVGIAWLMLADRVPSPARRHRPTGDVQSVYVVPELRGRGVGTALEAVLTEARRLELEHVTVHSNDRATPLYRRMGFQPGQHWLHWKPE